MKKTLIGILLIACLVMSLLPITALAANTAKILIMGSEELIVTEGGAPVYTKNKEFDAANTPDGSSTFKAWTQEPCDGTSTWNVKFEWPTGGIPTVTLKDAKFDYYDNATQTYAYIDKGGDLISTANRTTGDLGSNGDTANNLLVGAIMPVKDNNIDLKIILKGENKIETGAGFVLGSPSAKANIAEQNAATYNKTYFKNLTFVGEGENQATVNGGGIGIFSHSGYDVSFENVNLTISTTVMGSNAIPIHVTKGNLTINGGHIKAKNLNNVAIWTKDGGDITINGDITVEAKMTSTSGASAIMAKEGSIVINGGTIKGTGHNCPIFNATNAITINGGDLNLVSAYYAIYPGTSADFTINGGTLEVMAQRAFLRGPTLGANVKGYAGASERSCEPYEDGLKMKPWVILSDDESKLPKVEIDEEPDLVIPTTQPTLAPTAPTIPSTPTVTSSKTTAATKATQSTKATEDTKDTEATKATQSTKTTDATKVTAATKPVASKLTKPTTAKPIATQPVDETFAPEETLANDGTDAPGETLAPEETGSVETPDATEAPEVTEDSVTEDTKSNEATEDKDNNKTAKNGPDVVLIVAIVVVVLAAAGGAAWFFLKKGKKA